jgi:hypothetical protein
MAEDIDYAALYKQVQKELETLKLEMWAMKQRGTIARTARVAYNALLSRFADMTAVEILTAACILSIALHYHYQLAKASRT